VVAKLAASLGRALPPGFEVRTHSPLAVSDDSEPEPDVAVVSAGDYSTRHPQTALLVIEVADSSLQKDRRVKAALYAAAGIPEFWLVDLAARRVDVHRSPGAAGYASVEHHATETIALMAFPDVQIPVAAFLPPADRRP
jgi:Uma2 family endonuclease